MNKEENVLVKLYSKLTGESIEGYFTIVDGKPPMQLLLLMKIYDGIKILDNDRPKTQPTVR